MTRPCSVASINRVLEEKPDLKGIALPGMPAGSPGMGGHKRAPFVVYSFGGSEAPEPYQTF